MATTRYIWDYASDAYLMEKDEMGATMAVYTTEPVQYGSLVSQRRNNATSHYHFDGQGSTRELTDATQAVTDEYTYAAFGDTVAKSGATANSFRYQGSSGFCEGLTANLTYGRDRFMSTDEGRWLSQDRSRCDNSFEVVGRTYIYTFDSPIILGHMSAGTSRPISHYASQPARIAPRPLPRSPRRPPRSPPRPRGPLLPRRPEPTLPPPTTGDPLLDRLLPNPLVWDLIGTPDWVPIPTPLPPPSWLPIERIQPLPHTREHEVYARAMWKAWENDCRNFNILGQFPLPPCPTPLFTIEDVGTQFLRSQVSTGVLPAFDFEAVNCRPIQTVPSPNQICGPDTAATFHCKALVKAPHAVWVTARDMVSVFVCRCCDSQTGAIAMNPRGLGTVAGKGQPHFPGGNKPPGVDISG